RTTDKKAAAPAMRDRPPSAPQGFGAPLHQPRGGARCSARNALEAPRQTCLWPIVGYSAASALESTTGSGAPPLIRASCLNMPRYWPRLLSAPSLSAILMETVGEPSRAKPISAPAILLDARELLARAHADVGDDLHQGSSRPRWPWRWPQSPAASS